MKINYIYGKIIALIIYVPIEFTKRKKILKTFDEQSPEEEDDTIKKEDDTSEENSFTSLPDTNKDDQNLPETSKDNQNT